MKIYLKEVSKSYDKKVIDNIDLNLEGYDAVAIIGKSGCGKSTLLRLMTGIEMPDKGRIIVNDKELNKSNLIEYQDNIGIVFQKHNLFPHLTLLQNITLILEKIKKLPKKEAKEKAINLLDNLHLKDQMNKRPRFVSGGQAQRASIARALATDPEVVFMDEPTAALDPILTKEVLDSVIGLRNLGTKFVFVTHEIYFVRKFADYIIFMDEGKIVEQGTPNILDNPQTKRLQLFLENEGR
ncbi:amino acid ABC transporter ATP-binding protein [Defluviitalea phaphyphila]|uniref:amino acid ABC transporter ATP-binding protein n=1 Tax=Defluviitalea phaphyphila TaxID=1473580 RepID=UPI00073169E6|nr:ATP-binding cassette domain-containing protein [Defluviitalea phaphyphila]